MPLPDNTRHMKIHTVCFDYEGSDDFERLLSVFRQSLEKYDYELTVHRIPAPEKFEVDRRGYYSNTVKLAKWCEIVYSAAQGEKLLLIDADMMCLGRFDEVWSERFDIAMTYKIADRHPFNGGVIFLRVNRYSRAFFKSWCKINDMMLADSELHRIYCLKYAGINQAALGYKIEHNMIHCNFIQLPGEIYNKAHNWATTSSECKLVHVKGALRNMVFNRGMEPGFEWLVQEWKNYYYTDV